MAKISMFSRILSWLRSTEMFARPSKQLPGKWQLFEYYVDEGHDLLNINESRLKEKNEFWDIEFAVENKFYHQSNLPIWQISKINNGDWRISKNFITLSSSEDFRNSVEFQFAIEKEKLKLLKKDASGRIEFFGFLRKKE